jgi:hypothetical protein
VFLELVGLSRCGWRTTLADFKRHVSVARTRGSGLLV